MPTPSTRRDDGGFTLVEVVVAAVVLSIMAAATAVVLVQSLDLTRDNAQRVQAASVARTQLESVRTASATTIANGSSVVGTASLQGTTYSVTQTVTPMAATSGASCAVGNGDLAYKRITVSVSWPDMGTTAPVRADTLVALTPAERAAASTRGAVAVQVETSDGTVTSPLDAATATLGTLSQTTGVDGCVVFDSLAPGSYTLSVGRAGYVDVSGGTTTTSTVVVSGGSTTQPSVVLLAPPGSLAVTPAAPAGFTAVPAAAAVSLTLDTARFTPQTYRTFDECAASAAAPSGCVTGSPRTAAQLFPATYAVSAGGCGVAPPSGTAVSAAVTSGKTSPVTVALAPVTVRLKAGTSGSSTVTATSQPLNGCTPVTQTLTAVTTTGSNVALPVGTWSFSRSGGTTTTVTLATTKTTQVEL